MKKLLLLGGSFYLLPVIEKAHEMGCYVITCDYLPENVAHMYSDEYWNLSIVEKEEVLRKAEDNKIDGIMSFACDPGVLTAAYVAEKMGLPSVGSFEAVSILQNKGKFRAFLKENKFNVPNAKSYSNINIALDEIELFNWPVIVKPVDSAGSKGVTRVDDVNKLKKCIQHALDFSRSNEFIIEDFLLQKGYSSDADCFSVDGKLEFISFNSQRFDSTAENPYVPAGFSWPSSMSSCNQNELKNEMQRLISLLQLGSSIYNLETRECINGKTYIMECSPRGGGNRLAECIEQIYNVDLIGNSIRAALGEKNLKLYSKINDGYWTEAIIHADKSGVLSDVIVSSKIEKYIIKKDIWKKKGDLINSFSAANESIGTIFIRFPNQELVEDFFDNQKEYINIIVTNV